MDILLKICWTASLSPVVLLVIDFFLFHFSSNMEYGRRQVSLSPFWLLAWASCLIPWLLYLILFIWTYQPVG